MEKEGGILGILKQGWVVWKVRGEGGNEERGQGYGYMSIRVHFKEIWICPYSTLSCKFVYLPLEETTISLNLEVKTAVVYN